MDLSRAIVTFKAGRGHRREDTNWVDPSAVKGLVSVAPGLEDGLLHLYWVNRENQNIEEDLILFPGDASFVPVGEVEGGRTFVLKFMSSDQRLFFWMQDGDSSKDEENVTKLNRALASEEDQPMDATADLASSTSVSDPGQGTSTAPLSEPVIPPMNLPAGTTPGELARLRALLQSMGARGQGAARVGFAQPDFSLTHVLTPANLQPVLSNPTLLQTIFPSLPPDLPSPPSAETVRRIIESPSFQSSVRHLDQAFATGMLQGLVVGLGLPSEAGSSANAFLKAIGDQARKRGQPGAGPSGGDRMDIT